MMASLYDLLIKERSSVLFVGEGNFTFTVAFAALRQYECMSEKKFTAKELSEHVWVGITSTCYEPVGPARDSQFVGQDPVQCKPEPNMDSVKFDGLESCVKFSNKCVNVLSPSLLTRFLNL